MRNIVRMLCAVLVVVGIGFLLGRAHRSKAQTCPAVRWRIEDADKRQYVSEKELEQLLKKNGLYPVGKSNKDAQPYKIETVVLSHPMVRTAQCYQAANGMVWVRITQRIPLLHIVTVNENYWIDTERQRIPYRTGMETAALLVTGHVGERLAAEEISDFGQWLQTDSYWKERIRQVEVINPKMIHLKQRDGQADIILGEMADWQHKLQKVRYWYEKGEGLDLEKYQAVDVRYRGQVVGIKKR